MSLQHLAPPYRPHCPSGNCVTWYCTHNPHVVKAHTLCMLPQGRDHGELVVAICQAYAPSNQAYAEHMHGMDCLRILCCLVWPCIRCYSTPCMWDDVVGVHSCFVRDVTHGAPHYNIVPENMPHRSHVLFWAYVWHRPFLCQTYAIVSHLCVVA